jgi:hypothetical protein
MWMSITLLRSTPPLAVPPLSFACTDTVASPVWPAPGVNWRKPSLPDFVKLGPDENPTVLEMPWMTQLSSVWPLSLLGPALSKWTHACELG